MAFFIIKIWLFEKKAVSLHAFSSIRASRVPYLYACTYTHVESVKAQTKNY